MGLIKKYYQKIIVYGLITLGIIISIIIIIIRPQRVITQEIYNYNPESAEIEKITFPLLLKIPFKTSNIDYLELYFGDDSINNYSYIISATKNSESVFEHTYTNEQSNIIRIPLAGVEFKPEDNLEVKISCLSSCSNAKFKMYDTKNGTYPRIVLVFHSVDYRYLWYAILSLLIGITLIPLTKDSKK